MGMNSGPGHRLAGKGSGGQFEDANSQIAMAIAGYSVTISEETAYLG
jgi:hypothetical protein